MYALFSATVFLVILHQTDGSPHGAPGNNGPPAQSGWEGPPTFVYGPDGNPLMEYIHYDQYATPSTCPWNGSSLHSSHQPQHPAFPHQFVAAPSRTPPIAEYQPLYSPPTNTVPVVESNGAYGYEPIQGGDSVARGGVPPGALSFQNLIWFLSTQMTSDQNERQKIENAIMAVKNSYKVDLNPATVANSAWTVGKHMSDMILQLKMDLGKPDADTESMSTIIQAGQIYCLSNVLNPLKKPEGIVKEKYALYAGYQIGFLEDLVKFIDTKFGACNAAMLHIFLQLSRDAVYGKDIDRNLLMGVVNSHIHKPNSKMAAFFRLATAAADLIAPQKPSGHNNNVWTPPTTNPQHGQPGHHCTTAACQALDHAASPFMDNGNPNYWEN